MFGKQSPERRDEMGWFSKLFGKKERAPAKVGCSCDFCGDTIETGAIYTSDEIRKAARHGLRPSKHLRMGQSSMAAIAIALGLPAGDADVDWLARVARDTSDWAICTKCRTVLDKHV